MRFAQSYSVGDGSARLVNVVDIPASDQSDAQAWLARNGRTGYFQVADDNIAGAVLQQDGSYTNPIIPSSPSVPQELSGKAFTNYCAGVLAQVNGTNQTQGLARLGQIVASMKSSGDGLTTIAATSYQAALGPGGKFTLGDATTLLAALAANGAANTVTNAEAAAIITNWPKGAI